MIEKEEEEQEEPHEASDEEGEIQEQIHLIKMLGILPIEVKKEHLGDTARMVSFVNHVADIPGFILSEPLSSVHFLYSMACPKAEIEPEQFVATLGLVGTMMDLYQEQIENIATGKARFEDILASQTAIEEAESD